MKDSMGAVFFKMIIFANMAIMSSSFHNTWGRIVFGVITLMFFIQLKKFICGHGTANDEKINYKKTMVMEQLDASLKEERQ